MIDVKKYKTYIRLAVIFTFVLAFCSCVSAATFNINGTPTQFGWYSHTPTSQKEADEATYAVVYYPATIANSDAYCLQWSKPAPSNGTSMYNSGSALNDGAAAVIYEGKIGGYSRPAIQLAVYKAMGTTNSSMPGVFSNVKAGQYSKSKYSGISQSQLNSYKAEADRLIAAVNSKGYKPSFFKGSSNATIEIASENNYQTEKDGYIYIGPIQVKSTSGNPITYTLSNTSYVLVSSVGSTRALTQFDNMQQVFLKVPNSVATGSCRVVFHTRTQSVNAYVYSASGNYQDFGVVTKEESAINVPYTFNWKTSYKLKVVKKDANNPQLRLSGAKFKITNGSLSYTKNTDANGEALFDGLEGGTWYIEEVTAPSGYQTNKEKKSVSLSGSPKEVKQVEYYNEALKKSITVYKVDEKDTSKKLSGAIIGLYSSPSESYYITSLTTGSNGSVTFTDLDPNKTYYVKEIQAPTGYTISNSGFVSIDKGTYTYTFKDKEELGRISIRKYIEYRKGNISANSGVTFQVVDRYGSPVGSTFSLTNGLATTPYLRKGTYSIKEVSVNPSIMYMSDQKIEFTIGDEDVNRSTARILENYFINKGVMGEIEVYKYYTTSKGEFPIPGVKFYVYKGAGIDSSLDELIGTITTNAVGKASIGDLENGEYYVVEDPSTVPEGYIPDTTKKFFNITDTNKKPSTIKVENKIKTGTLRIIKISNDGNKVPIKDVEFDIYKSDKKTIAAKGIKTDANGIASVELIHGKYWIKEVSAPKYVIMNANWTQVEINDTTLNKEKVYETTLENGLISKAIKLYKVDNENNPIAGVKFALYSDSEGNNKVAEATTDSNGMALFNNLKVGTYYYKELVAPDGYITTKISDMKPISITDANYLYEETIVNTPILGKLKIHKIDEEDKVVEGAKFNIKDKDGKIVDTLTTDKDGIAISKDLRKGNYTIEEIYVPDGYVLMKEAITFTINNDKEVIEKEIINKFNKGKVIVKKIDSDTKEFLDGAVFEIYKINEKTGKDTKVDTISQYNDKGVGESGELKNGKYYLIETKAPDGAIIDNTKYEFEVTEKEKEFTFVIENKVPRGQIALIKYDNYNEVVEGVKFNILAEDKTRIIEELVTDKDGKATSKKLKLGTYYVKEVSAPERYLPNDTLIKCEIKEDMQVITLKDEIVNKRVPVGKIELIKTSNEGKYIEGVKFQVLSSDKKNVLEELVTNTEGKASSKELRQGTYYVKETWTPEIYMPITNLIKCEIKEDKQIITLQNEIVNKKITGGIKIVKTDDAKNPVAGVTFAIYKEGGSSPVATITTNDQGVALANDLVLGKYYFVETSVPEHIYIMKDQVPFEIVQVGQLVEKTVVNDRVKGKLVITKINSENGTAIEGVVFKIYDANKNELGTISTDLDGIATTENLRDKNGNVIPLYVGTYYYAEISAPPRFFFDSTIKEFKIIKGAENVNVTVENTPYKLPQTGGFISTDGMIILIVSIVSIAGYIAGNIIINRRRFY